MDKNDDTAFRLAMGSMTADEYRDASRRRELEHWRRSNRHCGRRATGSVPVSLPRKDLFRQIISLCSVTDFQHCCAFADTLVRYDDFRKTVPSESELSACWTFVIFDWAHGLDFPAWHRLALADEIAEEFGWPPSLSSFSRKEGFSPEDEARRMTTWQTWLNDERERWRPKHSVREVSK